MATMLEVLASFNEQLTAFLKSNNNIKDSKSLQHLIDAINVAVTGKKTDIELTYAHVANVQKWCLPFESSRFTTFALETIKPVCTDFLEGRKKLLTALMNLLHSCKAVPFMTVSMLAEGLESLTVEAACHIFQVKPSDLVAFIREKSLETLLESVRQSGIFSKVLLPIMLRNLQKTVEAELVEVVHASTTTPRTRHENGDWQGILSPELRERYKRLVNQYGTSPFSAPTTPTAKSTVVLSPTSHSAPTTPADRLPIATTRRSTAVSKLKVSGEQTPRCMDGIDPSFSLVPAWQLMRDADEKREKRLSSEQDVQEIEQGVAAIAVADDKEVVFLDSPKHSKHRK